MGRSDTSLSVNSSESTSDEGIQGYATRGLRQLTSCEVVEANGDVRFEGLVDDLVQLFERSRLGCDQHCISRRPIVTDV